MPHKDPELNLLVCECGRGFVRTELRNAGFTKCETCQREGLERLAEVYEPVRWAYEELQREQ